ncbi:MAG: beta-phosphoglucomutase [Solobacterium sp.]|nr:beta-phosphoglucomutase [Solobacterium sp.]
MNISGVIFDLDGVLCNTDEYHYRAWKATAESLGIPFDRTVNNRLRGISRMASLDVILEQYQGDPLSDAEKAELADEKNELYKKYLEQMSERDLSDEVKTVLDTLRKRNYRLAVGSSSKNTWFILQQLGLNGYFDAVSDGNNITRSKPDPEVFLNASGMLCIPPENCLVVEDAVAGAEAGHAGGMKVACLGDASKAGAGDFNMKGIMDLLEILK